MEQLAATNAETGIQCCQLRVRTRVTLVVLAALVPAAACSDGGSDAASTTSTSSSSMSTSLSTTTSAAQVETLDDGRHFVFVKSLTPTADGYEIEFDLARWFTGDAAVSACTEDGGSDCNPPPNDYYIRNVTDRLWTLPVDERAGVRVVSRTCCGTVQSSLDALAERGFGMRADGSAGDSFWLTAEEDVIVRIEEQYRP